MGAQNWTYGLILYFVGISVVWGLATQGISDEQYSKYSDYDVSVTGGPSSGGRTGISGTNPSGNESIDPDEVADVSVWKIGKMFKNLFSLYLWNISVPADSSLYDYLVYVRLIFIWIPGLFLILSIIYSLPTMSG